MKTVKYLESLAPAVVLLAALVAPPALAEQAEDPVAALRGELAEMRALYEKRIGELESRVRELEAAQQAATRELEPARSDLEALQAAAREAAATASRDPDEVVPEATVGKARNLTRLNPEISFTGDVVALGGDQREDFDGREFELDLQAALDPFSRTRWTLAFSPDEGVEIEEGWILYSGLPGGLALKVGKFRQRFGPLNQQHLHALPQADYPLALATYFDEEGLAQTGVAFSWLLPRPWASANELVLEVTDGESEAFGGEDFDRLVVLARLKNYWDLGRATYLEWGLTGISGRAMGGLDSEVLGSDLTLHWQPPGRAKYRELTWRTEVLRSRRDDASGIEREAWGGYSYVEALLRRNLYAGVRYDSVEDPLEPAQRTTGWFPYLTWWQSEYVRLRAQYRALEEPGGNEEQFLLQITWAAGPHKHESY
ncbi:MAG: hypothetical protein O7A04_05515 [Acidobacteria bacterium]|nr:hypothetical protein [Acidobacteriota bacterium]